MSEELGDDFCVAADCGAVEDGFAVVFAVPGRSAAVGDLGSGGEAGGEEIEEIILRSEDEDVVFVLGDE